jgi:hypothetical protein
MPPTVAAAAEAVGDAYAQLHEPMADAAVQPQRDVEGGGASLDYRAVQARYRGQGTGGLLQAVEQWARQNGAELISTDTEPGAARAGGGRPPQSERARLVQRRPRAPPKLAPRQAFGAELSEELDRGQIFLAQREPLVRLVRPRAAQRGRCPHAGGRWRGAVVVDRRRSCL